MTSRITIRRPDDWHLHVRDGEMLKAVMPFTARHFGRAILMPNLIPPVMTTRDAIAYRERALAARPPGSTFTPLMTCYLRDDTAPLLLAGTEDQIAIYRRPSTRNPPTAYTGRPRQAIRTLGGQKACCRQLTGSTHLAQKGAVMRRMNDFLSTSRP